MEGMDKNKKDILAEITSLRQNPYTVPEGHFNDLKAQVRRPHKEQTVTLWGRLAPYASLAAVFVSVFVAGSLLFGRNELEITQEDYFLFSENFLETYEMEDTYRIADAEIGDSANGTTFNSRSNSFSAYQCGTGSSYCPLCCGCPLTAIG